MSNGEPQGCLTALLGLFGIGPPTSGAVEQLPFRLRDDFLSPAEASFYQLLLRAVGQRVHVFAKVNLADLFFVVSKEKGSGAQSQRNKIDRKHVDFLLCDPRTLKPCCGIELDDASHRRGDRQARDSFVDAVFAAAGLPLLRVTAKTGYSPTELATLIEPHLESPQTPTRQTVDTGAASAPLCPKCEVPMIQRQSRTGTRSGQVFWGCPNYPRCRETVTP